MRVSVTTRMAFRARGNPEWLHRVVAGIAPATPGYREILFRPRPGGRLTSASAAHETPYGRAEIAWSVANSELTVDVTVPTGTTATVDLPGREPRMVSSGRHLFSTTVCSARALLLSSRARSARAGKDAVGLERLLVLGAARTRSAVAGATLSGRFSTFETVPTETAATAATSRTLTAIC